MYIREGLRGDFSAEDFRTWSATVLGAVELADPIRALSDSTRARRRATAEAIKTVSEFLGNTPAVCRRSYIDPRIIDRFEHGETIAPALRKIEGSFDLDEPAVRGAIEGAVIELLGGNRRDDLGAAA